MRNWLTALTILIISSPATASDRFIDIQELTTPSGLSIWLTEDHSVPVISLKFAFKGAGAFNESPEKQGLVQLLSNMMDEGAGDLESQSFQKALSDHSISLSFSGGRDTFSGSLKTLTEHQDKAFTLLNLALTKPRFDAAPLERMKQANLSRIKQSMTKPNWIAARIMNDTAFKGHPYAQNSGGTLTTLPTITAQDLRQFAKDNLFKERLKIAISGDITPQKAINMAEHVFGDLPNVPTYVETSTPVTLDHQGDTILFKQTIPQTIVRISLPGIRQSDPDYYAAKLMNHIYGESGFGSRLMETIREKEGLTYGIYSGLSQMEQAQTLTISTSTKNETVSKLLTLTKDEAKTLKTTPITELELQKAKDYILGSMPLSLTSTEALSSIMLSLQMHDLSATHLDTIDSKINTITIEDVQRTAKRLLNFDNAVTVLVGNPKDIEPTKTITKLPNVE